MTASRNTRTSSAVAASRQQASSPTSPPRRGVQGRRNGKEGRGPVKFLGLVAGTLGEVGSVETIAMAEWDRIFGVNVRANVLMMKQFIPSLRAAGGGSIVTITSWYGRSGHAYFPAYCASKAALISLTQSAAAELAGDNIRVNSVAPGNVATRMHFTALAEEAAKRGISAEEMKAIEWAKILPAAPPNPPRWHRRSSSSAPNRGPTSPGQRSTPTAAVASSEWGLRADFRPFVPFPDGAA